MSTELERAELNYQRLKDEHGVIDTRFYIGDIKDATPEQFAQEANIVMEAFLSGNTTPVEFKDSYSNQ